MIPRARLDAVVFDAGGTLVRLDFEWMCETVTALGTPLDVAALRRGEVAGRRRYDESRGRPPGAGEPAPPLGAQGDTLAYFGGMLEACGVPGPTVARALERFLARHADTGLWTRPVEGARACLDAIGAMGLRRAVVSNSDGRAERHLIDCGVREGIEFVVDSQVVGFEKPDPRIFRVALDRLGIPAGRALYVGDILCVDERGSNAAGMPFVLIDPAGDYAPAGVAAIREIRLLPQFIAEHFDVAPAAVAEGVQTPHRAVP